jgi:hypothetical protein
MSMAQVIEFDTLARLTPKVKWQPDEQRGKVLPFISRREVLDDIVFAAFEELDWDPSRWPECDATPYQAALEYAQPLILEEMPLVENFERHGKSFLVSSMPGLLSDNSPVGS